MSETEIADRSRQGSPPLNSMTSVSSDVPTHGNYHNYHGYDILNVFLDLTISRFADTAITIQAVTTPV